MTTEFVRRQIAGLLADAETAINEGAWGRVRELASRILTLDPDDQDGVALLAVAARGLGEALPPQATIKKPEQAPVAGHPADGFPAVEHPRSFASGRYQVKRFLGEGGKKRVYLAHDNRLDRDVAFALIKTEGLDAEGLARIRREAQAMGRLGDHPHIVSVFDIGEENGQPYIVSQFMSGGDVVRLLDKTPDRRLSLEQAVRIAEQACRALEHAHRHGIVHRDLKPGNVWLTEDGTAKLGDFGLALALDRSRLTQEGMMVGTAAYMPPEQALGSTVDARSDLYSLGCMLYEMVCGRAPFVAEESVAIITQHLNTPPVSPSWHRPDLPPALEVLILRLLEKEPSKRPASAAEVRLALASIDLSAKPAQPGTTPAATATDNPLYRRTFVGREAELRQLEGAFDAALSGQGSLSMVVGEPGIGKTALCEQLSTYVALRGGKALVGHCYEEGSLSLPYLPFVEAMRSYVLTREPDDLRRDLGSGAADVARLISEIRDRLRIEVRPPGDPEDDRWRLLQAVSGFLRNASTVQPLLVILEDLHDADRGTLDLLLHVSRNLQGSRLLIAGTYRDVEVDRAHPLSSALAELRRVGSFLRVPLRGLTVDEVHRMYCIIRGQEVPWSRAEAIHRQTEGNPLFVQEVLRYLVEEGIVVREGGRYLLADSEAGIPEGLRDVVGKRLSRLSEKANQVLSVATVIGREFRLDVLQQVAGLPEEELYGALEEATERAVVEQRHAVGAVGFRFTHAFFRQTLYEEIFVPRRIRLHQQVGKSLEEIYSRRLEEHAAELAEHFIQSTERGDLEKALSYSELAAKRAMQVFAHGEAVRHLEQALRTQEVLDPDDKAKRCDLLLALGEAMLPQEEPQRVASSVASEAFTIAEGLGDFSCAARAAVLACEGLRRLAVTPARTTQAFRSELEQWADRADRHAPPRTAERVYADIALALAHISDARLAEGHARLRRALDLALELGDDALVFAAAAWVFYRLNALRDRELVERLAHEVLGRHREGARTFDLSRCLYSAGCVLLRTGDREAAEAVWRELAQLAEHTRDASMSALAMGCPAYLAYIDGRFEEAISICELATARGHELKIESGLDAFWILFDLGQGTEEALKFYQAPIRPARAARALILARLGRHDEARAIREQFGNIGSAQDESANHVLLDLYEAALLGSDVETVGALLPRLAPLAGHLRAGYGFVFAGSIGRLLGDGSLLLGKLDEARVYYQQALEVCAKVRFRPEIALTRLALAELLLQRTPEEKVQAREHLEFAIKEFREMKMRPALERALRHKSLLTA